LELDESENKINHKNCPAMESEETVKEGIRDKLDEDRVTV
jgi:hypothetical protein